MELRTENSAFIDDLDTILFDCDGVLWDEHARAIKGSIECLKMLREKGKKIFFVTNNSTKTRKQYAERCHNLGFQASEDEIVCMAWLLAAYFKDFLKHTGKIYLIGGDALSTEFKNKGLDFTGPGIETYGAEGHSNFLADCLATELDPCVNAVAVGFDQYINYMKVLKAASYLQRQDCVFAATNLDSFLPSSGVLRIPGTGPIVKFVATAAEKQPVVVGKPGHMSRDILESVHGKFDPKRTMMVGDRLDTDIRFGNNCGFHTLLVLSGAATFSDLERLRSSNSVEDQKCVPTFYTQSLADLVRFMSR